MSAQRHFTQPESERDLALFVYMELDAKTRELETVLERLKSERSQIWDYLNGTGEVVRHRTRTDSQEVARGLGDSEVHPELRLE